MRCAALHRKLGTHISKVKSLSMDSWTSEQVDVRHSDQTQNSEANEMLEYENARQQHRERALQSKECKTSHPHRYRRGRLVHGALHPPEISAPIPRGREAQTSQSSRLRRQIPRRIPSPPTTQNGQAIWTFRSPLGFLYIESATAIFKQNPDYLFRETGIVVSA